MSLKAFVEDARRRVENGYYHTRDEALTPPGTFASIFTSPDPVVAELKPRSPSEGVLTTQSPKAILEDLLAGGAAALSILLDPDHFGGSIDNLRLAHATGLPVLFKDFVVDEAQIDCAAHHGCAAVLLIERILTATEREHLIQAAHRRGLQILLEVHSEDEWTSAKTSAADVIGVNARDLDTLDVDVAAQRKLLGQVDDRPVMALSGIHCRADRQAAVEAGADAVLVGTSLMRSPDRVLALTALRRPLAKVCGITTADDMDMAIAAGADLVGIVVLSDSPRSVDLATARDLIARARGTRARSVLVTRQDDAHAVLDAARRLHPDLVQWHHQRAEVEAGLATQAVGLITALAPGQEWTSGDGFVLDSKEEGATGGTGKTHDWETARQMIARNRRSLSLIAGGLGPDNVAEAIRSTGAWGADASSRLEEKPGIKDATKVRAFIQQAQRP